MRTRIGPIADRRLKPGQWRPLTAEEVRKLQEATVVGGGKHKAAG